MEEIDAINAEINAAAGVLYALRRNPDAIIGRDNISRDKLVARIWAIEHKIEGLFERKRAALNRAEQPLPEMVGPDVTPEHFVDPLGDYRLELKRRSTSPKRIVAPAVARHDEIKAERRQSYLGALLLASN